MKDSIVANRDRWLGITLAVVLLFSLFAPMALRPVAAQTTTATAIVTAPKLNVRSGPGAGYDVVGVVSNGEVLTLLGRDSTGGWVKVTTAAGLSGWVTTLYISSSTPISSLPTLASTEPQAQVTAPALNMRVGPGTSFPVVTVLQQGDYVNLLGRNENGAWLYARASGGYTGWVASGEVASTVLISSLPVTGVTGQQGGTVPSGPVVAPTLIVPTPQVPLVPGAPGATAAAPRGTPVAPGMLVTPVAPVPTPAAPVSPVVPSGAVAVVNAGTLNVRSGPGPGFSVVLQLKQGDFLTMVGRDSLSSWIEVILPNGARGWVSYFYITPMISVLNLPVTARYQPVAQVRTSVLNVRSGPGVWFPVMTTATENQYLTLLGRIPDSTWFKVLVDGKEGWVDASFVITAYPLKDLPVIRMSEEVFG